MTLIPPNVAALIEDAREDWQGYGDLSDMINKLAAALESAYASPARSLPTVEEVAEVLNQQLIVYSDYGTVAGSSIDSAARAALALVVRKGEAVK